MKIYGTVYDSAAAAEEPWRWRPYFTPRELACRHCNKVVIVPAFMDKLFAARVLADFSFIVTSGYRCPEHDESIGGKGPHRTGEAVDLKLSGVSAQTLLRIAAEAGFNGMGVSQRGDHAKRFIHLDTLDESRFPDHPRPTLWSY